MKTTIIIATRNRAAHLAQTLLSLQSVSKYAKTEHEIIVMDNGSTDGTYELAGYFTEFKFFHEARPGKSIACNVAARKAAGEILLFSDDDVRFPLGWIDHMTAQIADGSYDAVQGGVRIAPHLERPWLKGMLRTWLAEVGRAPCVGLVGANMAIRRDVYFAAGGLDERLGPGASGFYDDTKLGLAISPDRICHLHTVAVEHHFDEARLSLSAFFKAARAMANSAKIAGYPTVSSKRLVWPRFLAAFALAPTGRRESLVYWYYQTQCKRA